MLQLYMYLWSSIYVIFNISSFSLVSLWPLAPRLTPMYPFAHCFGLLSLPFWSFTCQPPLHPLQPRPTQLLQAPAELLRHDITHPATTAADEGAASGTGAAGAAAAAVLSLPTDHRHPDPRHQCQRADRFVAFRAGPHGGAQGKRAELPPAEGKEEGGG